MLGEIADTNVNTSMTLKRELTVEVIYLTFEGQCLINKALKPIKIMELLYPKSQNGILWYKLSTKMHQNDPELICSVGIYKQVKSKIDNLAPQFKHF